MAPIDQEDLLRLRELFATKEELHERVTEINAKLSNDMQALAVINTKISLVLWLLGAVGVAVIGVLIKLLFNV